MHSDGVNKKVGEGRLVRIKGKESKGVPGEAWRGRACAGRQADGAQHHSSREREGVGLPSLPASQAKASQAKP